MKPRSLPSTLLLPLVLAGCASTSPETAFHDTKKLVADRAGPTAQHLAWDQGGDDDAAVAKKVRELLSRELTVDAAVQVALLRNRNLQATYEDLSVAQADLVQAGLLQNPVFGGSIAFPVAGNARTGFALSVSQDFMSVFTLAARKRIASAQLQATELRVADSVFHMTYEVQKAFYALEATTQIAAMRRAILEAGDAALDLAKGQAEAGNISELDLASQEVLAEQVRTDVLRSEADVVTAREALTELLGLWGSDAGYRVGPKLPELPPVEVDVERLEQLAVGRRLDLAAAHAEVEANARALGMAKDFRWLGGTSVGGTYERAPEGFSTLGPGASLEVPLFDQKQAVIARLEGQVRAAHDRETALAIGVRSQVRAAQARLTAARAVVERYAKVVVPLRERVVALSQQQYDAMLLGAYQLLQVKQNEVVAYRELIEALRDYGDARADLERATGGTLTPAKGNETNTTGAAR